jgi:hypothetical protein
MAYSTTNDFFVQISRNDKTELYCTCILRNTSEQTSVHKEDMVLSCRP